MPIEPRADFMVNWLSFGRGTEEVLLLHCTMGSLGAWRGLIDCFSSDYRFTAFDMPGHGKSGEWEDQGDFHTHGTEIAKTFLGSPMHLIGHSFGGSIALRLALELPEMVRSLVLIEPVMMNLAFLDDPAFKEVYDWDHRLYYEAFEAGNYEKAAQEFSVHWGDGRAWRDLPERSRNLMINKIRMISAGDHSVYGDRYGFCEEGRLSAIDLPVLLIEGGKSHSSVAKINNSLERRLQMTSRVCINSASHMVPITHPQETAEAIDCFFNKLTL